jgi:4-hydroxy-4-methyl-2-oxoglutarate aldolase
LDITSARKIFENISTTQICDAAKRLRVLTSIIRPFIDNPKLLGKAFTVKADGDLLPVIKSLQLASADHVIMIDSGNSSLALAGEIFTSEAKRKHIAGIVIDGFCRDAMSIKKIGLPFYARGICPKAGSRNKLGQFNVPIECGGVHILPNDIVIGDGNGIAILAEEELEDTLFLAEKIKDCEDAVLKKIECGVSLLETINFVEHYDNISAGKESNMEWRI